MAATPAIRVLAVDDNDANLKLACILLEDLGLSVTPAHNGEQAVEIAMRQKFDLILMDLQMPGLDGRSAARRIRSLEGNARHTPIIALTAHLMPAESRLLEEEGLDDQIVKPISDAQIRAKLARWIDGCGDPVEAAPESPQHGDRIVDWELGCRLAHGNRQLAEEMMNLLVTTLPRDAAAIVAAWDARDMPRLQDAVHRLNGAIRYCGVPRLHTAVEALESAIKTGETHATADAMKRFTQATEDLFTWSGFSRPDSQ